MRTKGEASRATSSSAHLRERKLLASERGAIGALVALVLLAVVAFGASDVTVAALFGLLQAGFLGVLLLCCGWARRVPIVLTSPWPGLLFLGVLLATAWPLTPFGPGGAHPVWRYLADGGGAMTVDRSSLVLNLTRLAGLACLFLAAQIIGASQTRRRALVWWLMLGLAAYAAVAILDHVSLRAGRRLTGTLLSPNTIATLMGVSAVFAVMFFYQALERARGRPLDRLGLDASLSLAAAAIFFVALALTASRAGIFATVVGLAVFLGWQVLAQGRKARTIVILGGAAVILAMVGIAMRSADLTAARLENLEGDIAVRKAIFEAHWGAFLSSPWFGFGLGSFPIVNQLVETSGNLAVLFDVRATHNLYLQWLEEGGLVGSLAMLAWFVGALWRLGREAIRPGAAGGLARATIAATVIVLIHGLSDFAVQVPALQGVFALALGAMTAPLARRGSGAEPGSFKHGLAFAGVALAASALTTIPLLASRFGADLSAMPTAPAEVLAASVENGLATPADGTKLAQLASLSRREVALRPGSGAAWLRLAAVSYRRGETTLGNRALEHSLAVAPLQTSLFMARARLAYENWSVLTPAAREQIAYQVQIEFRRGGEPRLVALANDLNNPAGRLGLAFLIASERLARNAAQAR